MFENFYATQLALDMGTSDTVATVISPPVEVTAGYLVLEARNATQREIISFTGVAGAQLTGVTRGLGGTSAKAHTAGSLVEMNVLAEHLEDLYDAFGSFAATNSGGWFELVNPLTLTTTNAQREFILQAAGVDLRPLITKGSRLKVARTGSVPTLCADFERDSSQYATKLTPTGIIFTDDFTCEAWVKIESYNDADDMCIISRFNTSGFTLRINPSGQLQIQASSGANYDEWTTNQSIPAGRWTHVAGTADRSGNTSTMYIDGVAVPITHTQNGAGTSITQDGPLNIGSRGTTIELYDGKVFEPRIWSTVRTAAQIRDNMFKELTGSETGLVYCGDLDGSWNDRTANANHLTAMGGAINNSADNPFNATEYLIVTDIELSGSDTNLTAISSRKGGVPNATLGTAHYSNVKIPHGFPASPDLWQIEARVYPINVLAVTANWQIGSLPVSLLLPKGAWIGGQYIGGSVYRTTGTGMIFSTALSTSTSALIPESSQLKRESGVAGTAPFHLAATHEVVEPIMITSPTTYNLLHNLSTTSSVVEPQITRAGIKFTCGYL